MEDVTFNFENLKVYQKALDFSDIASAMAKKFPKHELYALSSQLNRAAISIVLNSSEGSGNTDAQFNRYLQMAADSVRECVGCTTLAIRRGYIDEEENIKARNLLMELTLMIKSLKNYLKNKKK